MSCHCDHGWICEQHPLCEWPHSDDCDGLGMQCPNPECPWWAEDPPHARLMNFTFVSNHPEITTMAPPDVDAIKTMLVVLDHTLTTLDKASAAATQLIAAQTSGKPLPPAALQHYRREFLELRRHRMRMQELIAKWWTLVEGNHP
jgi:hypothetical protein